MRGMSQTTCPFLFANSSAAEDTSTVTTGYIIPNATGFVDTYTYPDDTYIYIAIRRGPMKVPTTGTSVFEPVAYTGNGGTQTATTGFPVDAMIEFERTNSSGVPAAGGKYMTDRLRGSSAYLETSSTSAESTGFVFGLANNTGVALSTSFNSSSRTYIIEAFRRAPGTFDEVCYTGTGVAGQTFAHNLGVAPELMIIKKRSSSTDSNWCVYAASEGPTKGSLLNFADEFYGMGVVWNNTAPTASVFSVGGSSTDTNMTGQTHVAYLWATNPGVTKVGTYTGNGSSQTINCGFTSGARFVMIKAASTTGNWLVADSARGIVAGNDPALYLNSTAAEITGFDWIDADSTGFVVNETATIAANTNGVQYIYLSYA
jgi:hypothetical protein